MKRRRSLTRRVALAAFGILAIQLALALVLQIAVSRSVIEEITVQRLIGLDEAGALADCERRASPWMHRDGHWAVWSISADGRLLGAEPPVPAVSLPSVGLSERVEVGDELALVYAPESPGCSGVLFVQKIEFPVVKELANEFAALAAGRLLLLVLAAVAMVAVTAWPLVRRIRSLVARMNVVVADDFDGELTLDADDELGELADAFDAAARTARERLAELERRDVVLRRALADLAHDLRTPLATLKLSASSLPASSSASAIRAELGFLDGLTHNFEALIGGEVDTEAREDVRLDRLVERLQLRFAPLAADKGVEFNVAVPDRAPEVHAESIALERALGNLIHNALRWASAHVSLLLWVELGEAWIEVRDDGRGLSGIGTDAIRRGVRAPDARGEGFGLGLAIAEAAARRYGGRLELRDGPEGGTYAAIVLPVLADSTPSGSTP